MSGAPRSGPTSPMPCPACKRPTLRMLCVPCGAGTMIAGWRCAAPGCGWESGADLDGFPVTKPLPPPGGPVVFKAPAGPGGSGT